MEEAVRRQVVDRLRLFADASDEEVKRQIFEVISELEKEHFLSLSEMALLAKRVFNSLRRLDILQDLLDEEDITEVMVIGTRIFYERNGHVFRWDREFGSLETVENMVQRIVGNNNRQINTRIPLADARLDDGSRVHIVIAPVSLEGPVITIRRFPKDPITMEKLIEWGSVSEEAAAFLGDCLNAGYNIFISGGTGSGKTTFLNALSESIPSDERVIVIEDTAELQIRGIPNLVRLEARNASLEGSGEITIRDLVRAALRMRPNRIIVGEVRGPEAIDLLQAMNTGHDGSVSTGHANSTEDMLSRLETMVLMGMEIPIRAIRQQIAAGIDLQVHLGRLRDKSRKVLEISEITGVEDNISTRTLFIYDREKGALKKVNELLNKEKLINAGKDSTRI